MQGESHILTIGHSSHGIDRFVGLLKLHGVEMLADIRSKPYSRYSPQYNRETLKRFLNEAGLGYVHLGEELGGRPHGTEFYDAAGRVLYREVARSAKFRSGLDRLEAEMAKANVAIMCAEENPVACHRTLLVAPALRSRGIRISHIRGEGTLQADEELPAAGPARRDQLSLF